MKKANIINFIVLGLFFLTAILLFVLYLTHVVNDGLVVLVLMLTADAIYIGFRVICYIIEKYKKNRNEVNDKTIEEINTVDEVSITGNNILDK